MSMVSYAFLEQSFHSVCYVRSGCRLFSSFAPNFLCDSSRLDNKHTNLMPNPLTLFSNIADSTYFVYRFFSAHKTNTAAAWQLAATTWICLPQISWQLSWLMSLSFDGSQLTEECERLLVARFIGNASATTQPERRRETCKSHTPYHGKPKQTANALRILSLREIRIEYHLFETSLAHIEILFGPANKRVLRFKCALYIDFVAAFRFNEIISTRKSTRARNDEVAEFDTIICPSWSIRIINFNFALRNQNSYDTKSYVRG